MAQLELFPDPSQTPYETNKNFNKGELNVKFPPRENPEGIKMCFVGVEPSTCSV